MRRSSAALLLACCFVATSFVTHGFPREDAWHDQHVQHVQQDDQFQTKDDNWEEHLEDAQRLSNMQHQSLSGVKTAPVADLSVKQSTRPGLAGAESHLEQASVVNKQRAEANKLYSELEKQDEQAVVVERPTGIDSPLFPQARRRSQFKRHATKVIDSSVVNEEPSEPLVQPQPQNGNTLLTPQPSEPLVQPQPQPQNGNTLLTPQPSEPLVQPQPNVVNDPAAAAGLRPQNGNTLPNPQLPNMQPRPAPNPVQVYHPPATVKPAQTDVPAQTEQHTSPYQPSQTGKFPRFVPNTPQPAPAFKRAEPAFKASKAPPASKSSSDEGNKTTMWIAIAISVVLLVLAVFLCWFCLRQEEQEKSARKAAQKLVDDDGQPNVQEDTDPNAWTNRNSLGLNDEETPWYLRDESGKLTFSKPQFAKASATPATKTASTSSTTGKENSSPSEGKANSAGNTPSEDASSADAGSAKTGKAPAGKVTFSK